MPSTLLRLAAAGVVVAASAVTTAAGAVDAQRIARLLTGAVAATGQAKLTYGSASAEGDDVVLDVITLVMPTKEAAVTVPRIVISGAVERDGGGFTAERITFDGGTASSPAGTVRWGAAAMLDAVVPSVDEAAARSRLRPFRKLTLGELVISDPEVAEPIAVAALDVEIGELAEDGPSDILLRATGTRLPTSFITNPIAAAVIDRLGYSEIAADITVDGNYDVAADTVTVHTLTIDAAEIGTIAVAAKLSGLSFRALSDPEESAAARAAARLDSMTVRFDDGGFVKRMLDMQAGMLGGTPEDVRDQLVYGALPFALSFVDDEGFRDSFLAAAEVFLQDPRSLTITAAPSAPVPLGQVMRTALRTPLALPDLLTPDVVANH